MRFIILDPAYIEKFIPINYYNSQRYYHDTYIVTSIYALHNLHSILYLYIPHVIYTLIITIVHMLQCIIIIIIVITFYIPL